MYTISIHAAKNTLGEGQIILYILAAIIPKSQMYKLQNIIGFVHLDCYNPKLF